MSTPRGAVGSVELLAFSAAFRAALEHGEVTTEQLEGRLAASGRLASPGAITGFVDGSRPPTDPEDFKQVVYAEMALGVRPGFLLRHLVAPKGRRDKTVDDISDVASWLPRSHDVRRALIDLRLRTQELDQVEILDHLYIGADQQEARQFCRTVLRATKDGAQRFPVIHILDEGTTGVTRVVALSGCHKGGEWADEQLGIAAVELILDTPLALGEEAVVEIELFSPKLPGVAFNHERGLRCTARALQIAITFDPTCLPARVVGFTRLDPASEERELVPDQEGTVTLDADGFGPGVVGVYWDW